jgi:hypothetical protein
MSIMPFALPRRSKSLLRLPVFFLVLFFLAGTHRGFAQETTDYTQVIQKCLDLPGLQSHYATNADGSKQQVRILQHPFAFPAGITVSKFNSPILFVSRDGVAGLDAYINFTSFSIENNKATAGLIMTYGRNSNSPGSVRMTVSLEKVANQWNIINSTLEN